MTLVGIFYVFRSNKWKVFVLIGDEEKEGSMTFNQNFLCFSNYCNTPLSFRLTHAGISDCEGIYIGSKLATYMAMQKSALQFR